MPKLRKPPQPHAELRLLLCGTMQIQDLTNEDVGRMIGTCKETARTRMAHPGSFTVDELTRLGQQLGIPIERLRAAISYR